jgi:hypothetical protein
MNSRMLIYPTLQYVAFSILFASVMVDANRQYTILAAMVSFIALALTRSTKLTGAETKRNMPRSQYWGIILLALLLFSVPFYQAATGVNLEKILSTPIKIALSVVWAGLTILFVRRVVLLLVQSKA